MPLQINKMARYFLEVAYDGSMYGGFQIQKNTITIQGELEKALKIFFKIPIVLTGSSRTDAGVHARQNFFHADFPFSIKVSSEKAAYHINAILPPDIALKSITPVSENAHCRFDALSRTYYYYIYQQKDPFLRKGAYFYPYPINQELINSYATCLLQVTNFKSFSKKHSNVGTFNCRLSHSQWSVITKGVYRYEVQGNRFLRGMVRGLVGTMLKFNRGPNAGLDNFKAHVLSHEPSNSDFSPPGVGLTLEKIAYAKHIWSTTKDKLENLY